MAGSGGSLVVLTADRTLMAGYRLLFDGMLAASQTTTTPGFLMESLLMPPPAARAAPLGLRRIEAALARGGLDPAEIAVVDDRGLRRAIGPWTRVVGITAGEPLGRGMNSSTMTAVAGGRIYPEAMFRRLVRQARGRLEQVAPRAKVVVGGPGAWQLAADAPARRSLGIDHVVVSYAEGAATDIVRALIAGRSLPEVITADPPAPTEIPPVLAPSAMGVVEISRGCGLGCPFCTLAGLPMTHLPEETILADARTNVAGGQTSIAALSEDLFRYGGEGVRARPQAVIGLLTRLREIPGLRLIQIDHANIASAAQFSDADLRAVRDLLAGDTGCRFPWVNLGVETAAGALLRANGCGPKMGRVPAEAWGDFCAEQVRRLCRAGIFPMVSLVLGLPGEQEEDIRCTQAWVEGLAEERISAFPVLYAPLDGARALDRRLLTRAHWRLITACYRLNFRWIPRMYWDNQLAAGAPLAARCALQALGRGQALLWRALFAWRRGRAREWSR